MLRVLLLLNLVLNSGVSAQLKTQPRIDLVSLEMRMHTLINRERTQHKLRPLKVDDRLVEIARRHSRDMAERRFFDHISPEGKGPSDRGRAAGYVCRKYIGEYLSEGLAENIFQNNLYNRVFIRGKETTFDWNTLEQIAESTVKGWMASPGHRQNILNATYQRTGIGLAIASNDQILITQLFC